MILEEKIAVLVTPLLEAMAFELVRVSFQSGTLQIMAEPLDENREMTVEDCAYISRQVSALLDVEDPIRGKYMLEVSSPGVSRPLTKAKDYRRFAGELVKLTLKQLQDGRRRFNGRLSGIDDAGMISLETSFGSVSIPLDAVDQAKLDPSELFRRAPRPGKKPADTTEAGTTDTAEEN